MKAGRENIEAVGATPGQSTGDKETQILVRGGLVLLGMDDTMSAIAGGCSRCPVLYMTLKKDV